MKKIEENVYVTWLDKLKKIFYFKDFTAFRKDFAIYKDNREMYYGQNSRLQQNLDKSPHLINCCFDESIQKKLRLKVKGEFRYSIPCYKLRPSSKYYVLSLYKIPKLEYKTTENTIVHELVKDYLA